MKTTIKWDQLQEIAGILGIDEENIRTDYSGRFMYGDRCVGFVLDNETSEVALGVALAEVLAMGEPGDFDEGFIPDFYPAQEIASNARRDNMGLDSIVYFPYLTCEDRPEED